MKCDTCEVLYINGTKTHEHGCPEAWKDYKRECKWCGTEFTPESRWEEFCSEDCKVSYWN